jgi:carbonic anhydrase/acetyltransferase-like protein (isoleucine patch superfamily)
MGSPGKVVRELTEDEIRVFSSTAEYYVNEWKRYKAELKPDLS